MNQGDAPQTPSNQLQKPQAFSHMLWFFVIPCVLFMAWASYKAAQYLSAPREKVEVFEKLERINKARSSGDRWQAAYSLSQDLQKIIHSGEFKKWEETKRKRLFAELSALLEKNSTDERLKRYLYLTLGQLGDPEALPVLEQGLLDKNDEIRFFSTWGLVDILLKNPNQVEAKHFEWAAKWLKDTDASMRKLAAGFVLQAPGGNAHLALVEELLNDEDSEVRWNTAVVLVSKGHASGKKVLLEMFQIEKLRSFGFKSSKDLFQTVASAKKATLGLPDAEFEAAIKNLQSAVSENTPEGKAILSALK